MTINPINRKNITTAASFALGILFILLSQTAINAATRTWDGGGADNNWSTAANWLNDVVPRSADDVVFDATSTKNSSVDAAFAVNSVSINGGYTGTLTASAILTVNNAFTQSDGTFQGTAADANFNSLILNAGSTFNAPSGTLTLSFINAYYVFDYNGGTFNANGGTFVVDGRPDTNYFRGLAPTFNNLTVKKYLTVSTPSINVNGLLLLDSSGTLANSNINVKGDVTFASGYLSGSAILTFDGTVARTAVISGTNVSNPIVINNPNIIVTAGAAGETVVWSQKVTIQAGKLQQSAANYTFNVYAGFNNPGLSIAGGTFQGGAGNAVFNTTIGISSGSLIAGSGDFGTNAANCPAYPQPNYYFQQSGGTFNGGSGSVRFCDLRRTGGAFVATSGDLTILNYGDFAGGTFNANNGTLIVENNVSINAPGFTLNNVTLSGANGHGITGTPKPIINGTLNLAEGQFSSGDVAVNGDLIYGANFTGGGGRLFFEGTTTRTINLPARNILLGMTLDNPNITVTTSGAGASAFVGLVEVKRGLFQQGNAVLNFGGNGLTVSGGTFQGSAAELNPAGIIVSGGNFNGGTGLISTGTIETMGGTFSAGGDLNISTYRQSGGTFNAPNGLMTVVADWTHTAGGTFNGGTGTVKFTGYNTYNCANYIYIDVATTETFNNLTLANQFCNLRFIATGDTLIVNGDLRLEQSAFNGGRIRPLGTTTIAASNNGYTGSTIVEYVAPNKNFVLNNPSSVVNMLPVEMNAANSTLTSSGSGTINFAGMTLLNGTLNQPNAIWDFTAYPGYLQSGGIYNGSAAQLNISNGINGNILTGGSLNGGTGLINGGWGQTGGTFSTGGDMNVGGFNLSGGTFNAPLGVLDIYNGFSHTGGGTFNARTGTVRTSIRVGTYQAGFDVNVSETFNNLQFNGTNNNANHGIAAGDTLIVGGTLNFNGRGVNGGSIVANGDVIYTNYGGYQNASTLLKFQDTATRTVTFSNDCTSYFQPTLVDNPNITINSGCDAAGANLIWTSLDLRQGTVNAGNARSGFLGNFTQSGGTFNAGNNTTSPATSIGGDFTLSGGDYNAAPSTSVAGNYTHTGGGNFNYGTGTMIFSGSTATIDVDGSENFYNLSFQTNGGTLKTIQTGDTLIANGDLTFQSGYLNGGTLDAKKNVSVGNFFSGGSTALMFSGAIDQIFTNSGGITTSGTWTVNKPNSAPLAENSFAPSAPTNLLISGNIGNTGNSTYVPLAVVSGNVLQTGSYNLSLASLSLASGTSFVNEYGGNLTLGGDVANNGLVSLDANGAGCQADGILIRSSVPGTQRNWNGNGIFRMIDLDVKDQSGTAVMTTYSSTNSGNNGANWIFDSNCVAPTAAAATIGGRVFNAKGRGIANVRVTLVDTQGNAHVAVTNAFGFYRFVQISSGQSVTISVRSKNFVFASPTQTFVISSDLDEINFAAQ